MWQIFLILVLLTSCRDLDLNPAGSSRVETVPTAQRAILFRTNTLTSKRSQVYLYDLERGELKQVSTNESRDVLLFAQAQRGFVFNRVEGESNISNLQLSSFSDKTVPLSWNRSEQKKIPDITRFDPYAISACNNHIQIWSLNSNDSVKVFDREKESILDTATIAKPSVAFVRGSDIFVASQGLDKNYQKNNQQKLVHFIFDGSKLTSTAETTLRFTDPNTGQFSDKTHIDLYSVCPIYMDPCESGIERVDLTNKSTEVLWDWKDSDYRINGSIEPVKGGFLASFINLAQTEKFVAYVNVAENKKKEMTRIHTFDKRHDGNNLLLHDPVSGFTFIGDMRDVGLGVIHIFKNFDKFEADKSVKLESIPREGVFVR